MKNSQLVLWLAAALLGGIAVWYIFSSVLLTGAAVMLLLLPVFFSMYIPYAADNPEHKWFKRKLYGWGWTPVTWQGWLITIVYAGLLIGFAFTIDGSSSLREIAFTFGLPAVLLTITFIRIAYKTGERPRWQWGAKKHVNGEEDL